MESDVKHKELTQNLSGTVTEVFAHRFVVETGKGKILADLGPKAAERVSLKEGDHVELIGDMKPSELKVHSIAKNGAPPVLVDHPEMPNREPGGDAASRSISRFWAATRRGTWWNCTSS